MKSVTLLIAALSLSAFHGLHADPQTMYFRHGADPSAPELAQPASMHRTTLVRSDQPDTGSPDQFLITGGAGDGRHLRGLLQFDLGALPENAEITSVSLQMRTLPSPDGESDDRDVVFSLYALDKEPVVTEANWTRASAGNNWETPGGDRRLPALAEQTVNTKVQYADITWSSAALAEAAAASAAGGGKLNLLVKAADDVEAAASRALLWFYGATVTGSLTERPILRVDFTAPGEDPGFTFDPDVRLGAGAPEIDDAAITDFFYVDPVTGDNNNSGLAPESAVRTVAKGLQLANEVNAAGRPVKVILAPGEYIENTPAMTWNSGMINVPGFRSPAPVIIEGAGWEPGVHTGDVVVTGSEIWNDWESVADGAYQRAWPYPDWGTDPAQPSLAPPMTRRFEHVLVDENGDGDFVPYYQMTGPTDPYIGNMRTDEGRFYLDFENNVIVVEPPEGVSLNDPEVVVRVTTRKRLLYLYHPSLTPTPGHIVIRNIVFEHSGSVAVYFQNSMTSTVEDCVFRLNKNVGLTVESYIVGGRTTVRRSLFEQNGVGGFYGDFRHSLLEDLTFLKNARHSYIVEYFGWANCAMKLGQGHDITMRRWLVDGNYGHGAWLDTNIVDTELYDSVFRNNTEGAIFLEHNNRVSVNNLGSRTTVTVRENLFYDNFAPSDTLAVDPSKFRTGKAIQFSEHENALVKNNLMVNNQRVYHFSHNTRGPMNRNVLRWNVSSAPAGLENGLFFGQLQAWRDFADTLTNATGENVYMQEDVSLPFINRELEPVDFETFKRTLRENPLNTNPSDRIEEGSVFLAQAYDNRPLVTIRPVIAEIPEGATDVPAFEFKRVGFDMSAPLTVHYRMRDLPGDATQDDFAETLSGEIEIPAGANAAFLTVSPLVDGIVEGTEILHLELLADGAYRLGEPSAEVYILDSEAPELNRVSVAALAEAAFEGDGTVDAFRISRTGDLTDPLVVAVAFEGTAAAGVDYEPLPAEVTIPAGADAVDLAVELIDNDIPEPSRVLTLRLVDVDTGPYRLRSPVSAGLTILDDDLVDPRSVDVSFAGADPKRRVVVKIHNPLPDEVAYELMHPAAFIVDDNLEADDLVYSWVDIAEPENRLAFNWVFPNSDGISNALPMDFAFPFYGSEFSEVFAHSNGFLTFTSTTGVHSSHWPLPDNNTRSPANLIAGFWRNLGLDSQSGVYAASLGASLFAVQYENVVASPVFGTPRRASFQILLQPSGAIVMQYRFNDTGNNGTVGLQNADKTQGFVVARNEPFVSAGRVVRIIPPAEIVHLPNEVIRIAPNSSVELDVDIDGRFLPAGHYRFELALEPLDAELQPFRIPVHFDILGGLPALGGSFGFAGGWTWSPWLGFFAAYEEAPGWFYLPDHGFAYGVDADPQSLFVWTPDSGWKWFHQEAYPFVYHYALNEWVY